MAENINRRLNIYINDREVVNSMRGVSAEMGKVLNQMRNLNRGADDYDQQLAHLTNTYARLQQEQSRFRNDLAQTPGILGRIKNALGPVASGMLAAFSVAAIVTGFMNKVREAGRIVVEFDQKQATLAAIMQKSRLQIAGLTFDAIKLGASTAYSASEVSELQTELAKLGKTAPEIRAMTGDVLNAATALETDLASAAVLVGGQLNSYGENAREAARYSDIMANSANISATSYEYLASSLPKVSAVAAQAKVPFEELNGVLGVLADQNIQAETAGTGFRNILLESAKAGKPYKEMLDQIFKSSNQSKTAVELFGKENATVAVVLANSTQKINDQTKALENSAGSAAKLAKEKLNSMKGDIEGFSGAWEGFVLSIEKGDGAISKAFRGIVQLGTSFLNLLTPMVKVSDEIQNQQIGLNQLVSRITSTNIKEDERKRLMIQLKDEYPDFIAFIGKEDATNSELTKGLFAVNEQYVRRIALQKQVEKVEEAAGDAADVLAKKMAVEENLFKRLNEIVAKKGFKVNIDYGDLIGSAKKVQNELKKLSLDRGSVDASYSQDLQTYITQINNYNGKLKDKNGILEDESEILSRQQKQTGMKTEAETEAAKAQIASLKEIIAMRERAIDLGMKDAILATEQELRIWLDAYDQKQKVQDGGSEEDAKKRAKELADAKKHSEDLQKELEAAQRALLDTKRAFQDLDLDLQKEGYEKERNLLNLEYDRKIEDVRNRLGQEQKEIDKLTAQVKDPKNSKGDIALLKKQIDTKIEIQKVYNATLIAMEQTRDVKLATLQEKYLQKDIQNQEAANAKAVKKLQVKNELELAQITTLAQAKELLSDSLSADELKKIKTLEDAKLVIKQQHLKEEYELQKSQLVDMMAQIQALFAQEELTGITLISDEERASLLAFMDELALKFSEVSIKESENQNTEGDGPKKMTGIDVLGFDETQWEMVFSNLDTWAEKLEAVGTVVGGLGKAFGMYFQFVDNADQRSLQKFTKNNERKQRELADQLGKGYITQEVYTARKEKLEQDLDKKQAEMEYKKAKREKLLNIASVISNTAVAVSKALAQGGFVLGIPWAGIVAALGAVQLISAVTAPLPSKSGYKKGGFTNRGNSNDEDGPVHKNEYVIPENVLFSNDPIVPNVVQYLESKRNGESASFNSGSTSVNGGSGGGGDNSPMISVVQANIETMERLRATIVTLVDEGIAAYVELDLKLAKKIKKKIEELEKIENQAKR